MCTPLDYACCSACFTNCLPNCLPNCWPCCCPSCCFGKCFGDRFSSYIYLQFLKSAPGVVKICETLISGLILRLLMTYGLNYSSIIGLAFEGSLITTSACFLTSALLLVCYVTSEKAFRTIRFTHFEIMLNFVACSLYLSSAYFLATATKVVLVTIRVDLDIYPAMTIAYILTGVVGLIHGVDVYMCYKYYKTGK